MINQNTIKKKKDTNEHHEVDNVNSEKIEIKDNKDEIEGENDKSKHHKKKET